MHLHDLHGSLSTYWLDSTKVLERYFPAVTGNYGREDKILQTSGGVQIKERTSRLQSAHEVDKVRKDTCITERKENRMQNKMQ